MTPKWYEIRGRDPGDTTLELLAKLPMACTTREEAEAIAEEFRQNGTEEVTITEVP